jgi:hypothetical protein
LPTTLGARYFGAGSVTSAQGITAAPSLALRRGHPFSRGRDLVMEIASLRGSTTVWIGADEIMRVKLS